jgi:hypothetical protein
MKLFRTEINPGLIFPEKINWKNSFVFLGSCFADKISDKLKQQGLQVHSNPSGVLYNPQSIATLIQNSLDLKVWGEQDCIKQAKKLILPYIQGTPDNPIEFIHQCQNELHQKLKRNDLLIITFGTAWAYSLKENGQVVANCHKLPKDLFNRNLLEVDDIAHSWSQIIDKLKQINPNVKLVFTVSPVRHLRDNFRENQVSKSTLHLAIEKIIDNKKDCYYFPAYEIMMDELRDYRFYDSDMTHPSEEATEFIFYKFTQSSFDTDSLQYFTEASKILKLCSHRLLNPDSIESQKFIKIRKEKLNEFKHKYPLSQLSLDV